MARHNPGKFDAGERLPNVRAVIYWAVLTWLSSCVSVVAFLFAHNWAAAIVAVNACLLAAAYWLACDRWVNWRALAEAYASELVNMAARHRTEEPPEYD